MRVNFLTQLRQLISRLKNFIYPTSGMLIKYFHSSRAESLSTRKMHRKLPPFAPSNISIYIRKVVFSTAKIRYTFSAINYGRFWEIFFSRKEDFLGKLGRKDGGRRMAICFSKIFRKLSWLIKRKYLLGINRQLGRSLMQLCMDNGLG